MSYFDFDNRWQEICALLPAYHRQAGNCTEIWLDSGEHTLAPVKITAVLKAMARIFSLDLNLLKQKYRTCLGVGKLVPLPLHSLLVLVPLKVRNPLIKDDGAFGYLVYDRIVAYEALKEEGCLSQISLTNGQTVKSLHSKQKVMERLEQAKSALAEYRRLHLPERQETAAPCKHCRILYVVGDCPCCGEKALNGRLYYQGNYDKME